MSGAGILKKQASSMTVADMPKIVHDLKHASYAEKDRISHLIDILALHQQQNAQALVGCGAVKALIDCVATGSDGTQIHAASALATIAADRLEFQDTLIKEGAVAPLVSLLHRGSNKAKCAQPRGALRP
jgi:hypothetical protein